MYETHWKLESRPFDSTSDPRFFFPGESAQAALLKLRYVVESRQPCAALVGGSGVGKTLVCQTLLQQAAEFVQPRAHLVFPQMPPDQLVAYLAESLSGEPLVGGNLHQNLRRLERFLEGNAQSDRHALVIVDEAHLLREAHSLQALRLLLNLEVDGRAPWTIVLAGQPALLTQIERVADLEERLSVKCVLQRFSPVESADYVRHRLATAGGRDKTVFDNSALEALHRYSQGTPRRLNRLADLAMVVGFAEERSVLSADHVEAVAQELTATVESALGG